MAPASITTLPNEILFDICASQCRHCSGTEAWPNSQFDRRHKSDLASLSQTCRRLRDIAQPLLYHDIHAGDMMPLLRTVIARPDLAAQIRGLCNNESEVSRPLAEDLMMLEAEARRLGIRDEDKWVELMLNDDTERGIWLLELTLSHLPNAEALTITLPYGYEYGFGNLFKRSVVMGSVKRLSLCHWDNDGCAVDLGRLGDFLAMMPCLESLEVNLCGGATQHLPLAELRSLVFTQSNISAASLKRLVSSCPKLESFEYWSPGMLRSIGEADEEAEFTWGQAQRILHQRRKTLKHLNLEFGNAFVNLATEPLRAEDYLGSLRDFEGLEILLVRTTSFGVGDEDGNVPLFPASAQHLVDMLPGSLTILGFCGSHEQWHGAERLAQAIREGHFAKLQRVLLDQGEQDLGVSREILATVGVVCEKYDYVYHSFSHLAPERWVLGQK
ncbi:hypothetical protein V8C37DRAFT_391585 [Trichoderma ceciliae]